MSSGKFVTYSSYLIYLSLIMAIIFPDPAIYLKDSLSFLLIILMTFSIIDFKIKQIDGKSVKEAVKLTFIHYFLLSNLYIIASYFIPEQYKEGFIVLAIIPPAISIIATSKILRNKINNSFLGLLFSYLFSFLYSPIIFFFFLKESISIFEIIKMLVIFIILPFLVSRLLRKINFTNENRNNIIVNVIYALLFYIVIGVKSDVFFYDIGSLWPIFLIMVLLTFGIGVIVYLYMIRKQNYSKSIDYLLFSTYKNNGFAAVLAISLFGLDSVVPISARAFISPIFTVFLLIFTKKIFNLVTTSRKRKV